MEDQKNPLIEQENYFAPYNESIKDLRNNPEVIEFDKLCYEVFEASEMGRKFIEFATQRFIVYSQVTRGDKDYSINCVWQEGFRDAYRMIMSHILSHKQRIQAGKKE